VPEHRGRLGGGERKRLQAEEPLQVGPGRLEVVEELRVAERVLQIDDRRDVRFCPRLWLLLGHPEREKLDEFGGRRRVEVAQADDDVAELGEYSELTVHAGRSAAVTVA
jgi:hypothetical protein